MAFLISSDLHLTDAPLDSYRFRIFDFLANCMDYGPNELIILGDLTDRKDEHSAELVNRIVGELKYLAAFCPIKILCGNHDYINPENPFFGFLSDIPNIIFITQATIDGKNLYLPHSRSFLKEYETFLNNLNKFNYVFMHQTLGGSRASNGFKMEGIPPSLFKKVGKHVYSGDIHVPQTMGKVTYVGSPYPVRFGDDFEPRVLFVNNGTEINIPCNTIHKAKIEIHSLKDLNKYSYLNAEDQVKLVIHVKAEDVHNWVNIRQTVLKRVNLRGWDVCGVEIKKGEAKKTSTSKPGEPGRDDIDIFTEFCTKEGVKGVTFDVGKELLIESLDDKPDITTDNT